MSQDAHYRVLKALESNPQLSQRELAQQLGISLGKTNYCLKALIDKGWIKAKNFKNSGNKLAYAYLLTPKGIDEKARLTLNFLERKRQEYETLRLEIEALTKEAQILEND